MQIHGRKICSRLLDQYAGPVDEQVRVDCPQFAIASETNKTTINTGPDDEMIVVI
jgi:hypothetical protein